MTPEQNARVIANRLHSDIDQAISIEIEKRAELGMMKYRLQSAGNNYQPDIPDDIRISLPEILPAWQPDPTCFESACELGGSD